MLTTAPVNKLKFAVKYGVSCAPVDAYDIAWKNKFGLPLIALAYMDLVNVVPARYAPLVICGGVTEHAKFGLLVRYETVCVPYSGSVSVLDVNVTEAPNPQRLIF